jgi:hypothetical protein
MKRHDIGDLVKFKYYDSGGKEVMGSVGLGGVFDIVGIVVRRFWEPDMQTWYYTCYFGEHGTCDCEQSTLKNLTKISQ